MSISDDINISVLASEIFILLMVLWKATDDDHELVVV
jgi:hypothetical protein